MQKIFLTLLIILTLPGAAPAHSGRTDDYAGHNNCKAGGYHFHRGPLAGQVFKSKEEAVRALQKTEQDPQNNNEQEKDHGQKQKN